MSPISFNPDGSLYYVPDSTGTTSTSPTPDMMRQFMREIGRRGAYQRSLNFARRSVRSRARFMQRWRLDPNQARTCLFSATSDERHWLKEFASRGGRARAVRYSHEQLRAWAAKGGHARARRAKALRRQ